MNLQGKKLGIMVSAAPGQPGFHHALRLAETALNRKLDVYLYCIDDATAGLHLEFVVQLRARGLKLYGCAYGAQRRGLPLVESAIYGGLSIVSDFISSTDRFLCFT